jgi:hypothetical protein
MHGTLTKEPPKVPEPFGPLYPNLGASVAKWRKIKNPTPEQREAHGRAIEEAIRALQRRDIGAALRAQQSRALLAFPEKVRRERTPVEWRDLYANAMGWTTAQVKAAIERQSHE